LTDGSIGDMIYFHSFRSPGLILDIVGDIRALNELARKSKKAGMIVLGGGVCKHQIANAMLIVVIPHPAYAVVLTLSSFPFSAMALTIRCSLYAC
jgi:deoxyhypusine synthase